jgi:hypothetical protein
VEKNKGKKKEKNKTMKITSSPHVSLTDKQADNQRLAPAVAALLNASVSEDSHRGPYQQA